MAEFLREEVSKILVDELADPRLGFSTVTGVELADDFSLATVNVSFFVPGGKRKAAIDALNNSAGYIREKIKPLVRSKRVPTLRFVLDERIEKSARIAQLLRQDKQEKDPGGANSPPEEELSDDENRE